MIAWKESKGIRRLSRILTNSSPLNLFSYIFLARILRVKSRKTLMLPKKVSGLALYSFLFKLAFKDFDVYGFVHLLGMATRFRKGKLSKIQEKKAKTRIKEGLLTKKRKKDNEPLQEDTVVFSSFPKPTIQRPASPTSSLELITPTDKVIKTCGRNKSVLGTF